jgi:hypothetical protein
MNFLSRQTTPDTLGTDAAYLPEGPQTALARRRSLDQWASVRTERNWWRGATALIGIYAVLATLGWRSADEHFANDVRVAWVKLMPNGAHQVEYFDDGAAQDRWFDATINASLTNYAEHRYRLRRETIQADYGFAMRYMSDDLRTWFLGKTGMNAPKVAADFIGCAGCSEVDIKVHWIDSDTFNTPDRRNALKGTYESTVYFTETTMSGGTARSKERLAKILWSLQKPAEIEKNYESLSANPLGMKIISEKVADQFVSPTESQN